MQTIEGQARAVCGAKTRSGGTCHNAPLPNGRCRMHGGHAASGTAHYKFKTGRYSKYMPQRLLERYNEGVNDPDLLTLHDDVAVITTRLSELLDKVDKQDTGAAWKALRASYSKLQTSIRERDTVKTAGLLVELETLIDTGTSDWALWQEISSVMEQRRKLVETERRLLIERDQVITVEQMMIMARQFMEMVTTHVRDRDAVTAIAADIRATLLAGNGGRSGRG